MKFATLIATAAAVKITQRATKGDHGPTPADIIDECDTNGNGMLSKKEVRACIAAHVPEDKQEEADAMVDEMWSDVDADGSGEVDEHELSAAMRKGKKGGKKGGKKDLAQLFKKGGKGSDDEGESSGSDSESGSDGEKDGKKKKGGKKGKKGGKCSDSEESEEEALVQKKGGKKGPKGGKGSDSEGSDHSDIDAADVIEECDTNEDGKLNKKEVKACIKQHVPEEHQEEADAMVDEMWDEVDKDGSGEVDEAELEKAMEEHEGEGPKGNGPKALARVFKGPSASDIISMCDADESGGITKAEAHACIDAHVPEEDRARVHAMVDETFDEVDADGSGEVDEDELAASMKAHKGGKKGKKGGKGKK